MFDLSIDHAVIEDTGSTDGTQNIIQDYLEAEGLPGEVFEEPWQDFAWNKSLVLERLRQQPVADYALMMDADDVAVLAEDFDPTEIPLVTQSGPLPRRAASRRLPPTGARNWSVTGEHFRYRGVLHEFIEGPPEGNTTGTLRDFHIIAGVEGNRSRNPNKYGEDAALLERTLETR